MTGLTSASLDLSCYLKTTDAGLKDLRHMTTLTSLESLTCDVVTTSHIPGLRS